MGGPTLERDPMARRRPAHAKTDRAIILHAEGARAFAGPEHQTFTTPTAPRARARHHERIVQ
jgi:hypothetical protein